MVDDTVFNYSDTHSSRAGIISVNDKLKNQRIAIIGLGGTGAYVLDFVSKTPVKEITLIDGDDMLNHNAFRAPGAMSIEELRDRPSKVSFLKNKYEKLRKGIIAHEIYLKEENLNLLDNHDFVFISIDKAEAKKPIIDYLISVQIPFVDLGMGVTLKGEALRGTVRILHRIKNILTK